MDIFVPPNVTSLPVRLLGQDLADGPEVLNGLGRGRRRGGRLAPDRNREGVPVGQAIQGDGLPLHGGGIFGRVAPGGRHCMG